MTGQSAAGVRLAVRQSLGASDRHDQALRGAGYRYLFSNTMIHRVN